MNNAHYRVEDVATAFRCEPEQEEIISALAERDFRIFEVEQPAGAFVPYHTHDEEESVIVLDGAMNFNVEEEIVRVSKGEVITIREEAIHAAAPAGDAPARLLIAFPSGESDPAGDTGWEADDDEDSIGYA